LNTHRHNPTDTPTDTPTHFPTVDAVRYGRAVIVLGEDGDHGVLAVGHDRRALAAISAHGREIAGPRWARGYRGPWVNVEPLAVWRWALFQETCGCTPDQHTEHARRADTDPGWDLCPCPHSGLPPCEPDRFAWLAEWVPAGTPGAMACTEVPW
jgi:hypothetical protein